MGKTLPPALAASNRIGNFGLARPELRRNVHSRREPRHRALDAVVAAGDLAQSSAPVTSGNLLAPLIGVGVSASISNSALCAFGWLPVCRARRTKRRGDFGSIRHGPPLRGGSC